MIRVWRFLLFWVTCPVWAPFALLMYVDRNHRYRWFWWVLLPLGIVFLILDILYNWTFGTLAWGFPPKRITYSQRLEDEWHAGSAGAEAQASILNALDPGHITHPPAK